MTDDERPGLRPALLAAGLFVLVVLTVPLGFLVREKWGPLARLDTRVEAAVHRDAVAHGWLGTAGRVLTWLGSPVLLELATVVIVVVLAVRRRRRNALYLASCVAGAYTLSTTGKHFVARARPSFPDAISHARGASFPSGHATGSAAFYLGLAVVLLSVLQGRRALLLLMAAAVPLVVATTRVVIGVHYVSDVAAGLLIGWGWAVACTALFTAWRAQEGRPVSPTEQGIEPEPAAT